MRGQKKFPIRGNVEYVQGVGLKPAPEKDPAFDMRKAYGIPADHKVVVSVGELTEGKNNEVMLRAMDRFRRKKTDVSYLWYWCDGRTSAHRGAGDAS